MPNIKINNENGSKTIEYNSTLLKHNTSRLLLITIYTTQKQDNKQTFLEECIDNVINLVQCWADKGKIVCVIYKNDNTK